MEASDVVIDVIGIEFQQQPSASMTATLLQFLRDALLLLLQLADQRSDGATRRQLVSRYFAHREIGLAVSRIDEMHGHDALCIYLAPAFGGQER
jgi:hypothetical protein